MIHAFKALVVGAALAVALGWGAAGQAGERLSVVLDFFVNPSQLPLFVAQARGHFAEAGLDVEIREPADPSDPPQLAAAGRADLALTTSFDLTLLRANGLPLTAVGSLIQSPLGGLMALEGRGIDTLSDLAGKRIGFALEPEEPALWRAMLASAGVAADEVELVNVGFDAVPALLGGQVDAVGAFRNFEPILLGLDGVPTVFFPFEDHGVPSSWQLVFVAGEAALAQKGEAIGRFLEAVARAVAFTLKDPNRALDDFFAQNPALAADDQRELNIRSALATLLLYQGAPCHDDAPAGLRLRARADRREEPARGAVHSRAAAGLVRLSWTSTTPAAATPIPAS